MAKILVLHDQQSSNGTLIEALDGLKHEVTEVSELKEALNQINKYAFDIVFLDQEENQATATFSLKEIKAEPGKALIPVVVTTSNAKSNEIIEAMRLGAFDHLSKPLDVKELKSVIERAVTLPKQDFQSAKGQAQEDFPLGVSPEMRNVEKRIGIAAACDTTVLIAGETGTGKSTVAEMIHRHSGHKNEPLTVIDCTAVPENYGSFQSLASGSSGTVILDEIGDLNPMMQAMLVRALKETSQSGSASALRIIATTQYDLINMVKDKRFREDLYYRLNVFPFSLPPLRDRGSDVLVLSEAFLRQSQPETAKRLSSDAVKILLEYKWPGNVRELQSLMYHLSVSVRSAVIQAADLNLISEKMSLDTLKETSDGTDYHSAMAGLEKKLLLKALQEANGSRAEASRILGINRQLLYAKLKTHGLMNFGGDTDGT